MLKITLPAMLLGFRLASTPINIFLAKANRFPYSSSPFWHLSNGSAPYSSRFVN